MSNHPNSRRAAPQARLTDDSILHMRRKKPPPVSRPFPPGFIPVVQPPPLNRQETQRSAHNPTFLPPDLRSPLPPSFGSSHKEFSPLPQSSILSLPPCPFPTSNQQRLMPSIKRFCNTLLLGHRQLSRFDTDLHPGRPVRSQTDQGTPYNRLFLLSDAQVRNRSASTFGPKIINSKISNNENHRLPTAIPSAEAVELPKKPSVSERVIQKAKSIGELRPKRNRSISSGSSPLESSWRSNPPCPGLPKNLGCPDGPSSAISRPQVSATKRRQPGQYVLPDPIGKLTGQDKPTVPTVPAVNANHHCANQNPDYVSHKNFSRPTELPYYIKLESIDILERAHDHKSSNQEELLVSF